ncbi:MAG: WG repeat-containing protein [Candidatus Limiplasma sp.]|nr:WG repeat-containing protein [Candidatus Limiplasma sp.]
MQTTGTRKAQHEKQEAKTLSNGQIEFTTYRWETDVYKTRILLYDTATREFIWESSYSFDTYAENKLTEKMLEDIRGALITETTGERVVWASQDGVAYFRQNGKIGLVDPLGNELLAPVLDLALPFENGIARVNRNGLWGVLDRSGTFVSEPQWEALGPFSEGVAVIVQNGQYGYLSADGEVLCQPRWSSAETFQNGAGVVEEQTAAGHQRRLVDAQGNVSGLVFKWYDPTISEGLVYMEGGYYSIPGKLAFEVGDRYGADMGYPFKEGRALLSRTREGKTLYGVVDTQGTLVSELQWEWVASRYYKNGLLSVAKGDQACLLDPQGKVVATAPTDGKSLYLPSEGLWRFQQSGKYGFYTLEGGLAIAPEWSEAHDFSEGLAAVSRGSAWGYIDRSGTLAIEYSFERVLDFQGGRAFAKKDRLWGVIDSSGA